MNNPDRQLRIRRLVKKLNKDRKKQAKQIDILCNDIIQAHRGFIQNLDRLAFTAQFCESIIGISELDHLLYSAAAIIKRHYFQINLAFCIKIENDYNIYSFEAGDCQVTEAQRMEQYFNNELIANVINSGENCMMDDLLEKGLLIKPNIAKQISVVVIPFADSPLISGFIMLYNTSGQSITESQIDRISSVRNSLSVAMKACLHPQNTKKQL